MLKIIVQNTRILFTLFLFACTTSSLNPSVYAAEPATLLIMGDSLSAGYGVSLEKIWARQLAQQLQTLQPPIRVINDSISGETSAGVLARLPAALQRTKPQWVFIAMGANDGLRGQSLSALENNLRNMIRLVRQQGATPLLAGMRLPPNYGKIYTERFYALYQKVAEEENVALLPFLLKDVGGHAELMQADGMHPNEQAQGIIFATVWQFLSEQIKTKKP